MGRMALVGTILNNFWQSCLQDNNVLKLNAAIFGSLGQITSRSFISINNTRKIAESGQGDEAFARRETAKTVFREFGGFTLNYGVLKVIDTVLNNGICAVFNGQVAREGSTGPLTALGQITKSLTGGLKPGEVAPFDIVTGASRYTVSPRAEWKKGLLKWCAAPFGKGAEKLAGMNEQQVLTKGFQHLHTWGPLAVGTVASTYLAGWFLERMSLLHGQEIIDFLSGTKGAKPAEALPAPAQVVAPFAVRGGIAAPPVGPALGYSAAANNIVPANELKRPTNPTAMTAPNMAAFQRPALWS